MWPSPSKIPTIKSFISLGNVIEALSLEDKRVIPFVERAANNITLAPNERVRIVGEWPC